MRLRNFFWKHLFAEINLRKARQQKIRHELKTLVYNGKVAKLNSKEVDCLMQLINGASTNEIAYKLKRSTKYVEKLFQK